MCRFKSAPLAVGLISAFLQKFLTAIKKRLRKDCCAEQTLSAPQLLKEAPVPVGSQLPEVASWPWTWCGSRRRAARGAAGRGPNGDLSSPRHAVAPRRPPGVHYTPYYFWTAQRFITARVNQTWSKELRFPRQFRFYIFPPKHFVVFTNSPTPVPGNAIPVLGVKLTRGKCIFWLFFKVDLCSATSMESSLRDLSNDVVEHKRLSWKITKIHSTPVLFSHPKKRIAFPKAGNCFFVTPFRIETCSVFAKKMTSRGTSAPPLRNEFNASLLVRFQDKTTSGH